MKGALEAVKRLDNDDFRLTIPLDEYSKLEEKMSRYMVLGGFYTTWKRALLCREHYDTLGERRGTCENLRWLELVSVLGAKAESITERLLTGTACHGRVYAFERVTNGRADRALIPFRKAVQRGTMWMRRADPCITGIGGISDLIIRR